MSTAWRIALLLAAAAVQSGWPPARRPLGVTPDLTLAVIVAAGLAGRPGLAVGAALLAGTLLDMLSALPPGTNLVGHLAAAGVASLAASGPLRDRPWLVVPLPPLATAAAYLAAAWRLYLGGWPGVWSTLVAVLPVAILHVSFILLSGWLVAALAGLLRPRPVRL